MTKKHIYPEFMQTGSTTTWVTRLDGPATPKPMEVLTCCASRYPDGRYKITSRKQRFDDKGQSTTDEDFIRQCDDINATLHHLEILENNLIAGCNRNPTFLSFNDAAARKSKTHHSQFHPDVDLAAVKLPYPSSVPVGTIPITVMLTRDGIGPEETAIKKKRPPAPRFRP